MERLRTSREVGEFQYILAQAQLSRQQYGLAAAKTAQHKASTNPPLFQAEQQVELSALQAKSADILDSLQPVCARFARLQESTLFEQEFTIKLVRAQCIVKPISCKGHVRCTLSSTCVLQLPTVYDPAECLRVAPISNGKWGHHVLSHAV